MDLKQLEKIQESAKEIRKMTIAEIGNLGVGHIGGCMSIVDLLALLYDKQMKIDPSNPKMENRDRLICSKGHAGPAIYAALAYKGYFSKDLLMTLNKGGTNLPSHCDMNRTIGIDMTTGSLGQGLSAGIGMCLGLRLDGSKSRVFVIIGDGECDEGQIWEAAMTAAHFKVSNITVFMDYNKMQIDGKTEDIMDFGDIEGKWKSFGWYVQRVDGHDIQALDEAIEKTKVVKDKPSIVIMDTIKGKGCSFCEGQLGSHNMNFDMIKANEAISILDGGK